MSKSPDVNAMQFDVCYVAYLTRHQFSAGMVSRFRNKPGFVQWQNVKMILQYLRGI